MSYSKQIQNALDKHSINLADKVQINLIDGTKLAGILLPRIEIGDSNSLTLKLSNGYNVGISFSKVKSIEKLPDEKYGALDFSSKLKLKEISGLPFVYLIATGGTISARVDYRLGGVKAVLSPQELFFVVPELEGVVNFKSIISPFTVWSENMSPVDWKEIAKNVAEQVNSSVDGVVVTHGTDTLSYTSAALSFMLPNLSKPVALVGAQRSPDRGSFDGAMNLVAASRFAGFSKMANVAIVMHATANDDYCYALRGTKVRKMHTSRRDAFRPINDSPLAKIYSDGKIEKISNATPPSNEKIKPDLSYEEKVYLLKAFPGSDPCILDYLVEKKYKGVIIEATALGHVALQPRENKFSWQHSIKNAIDNGVVIGLATQCLYGTANPFVYETGRLLNGLGTINLKDMLPEVALIKLGFLLGHKLSTEQVKEKMLENLAGEFNNRITHKQFLN